MDQIKYYTDLFKALSDETRLKIVVLLFKREFCVCQIEAALGISQTKASRHLALLRHLGLLKARREGLWVYYTLEEPKDKVEEDLFKNLRDSLSIELSSMEELAKTKTCSTQTQSSEPELSKPEKGA
ncbi:MAG: ArsR/SmtB family transcription factor [Methanotrichaceae archaeon]